MSVNTIKQTNINIGVDKPFSFIHISDTHFTLADERDDPKKTELANCRSGIFVPSAEEKLSEAEEYAKSNNFAIAHTGDIIDFVSEANLERAKKFIDENTVFFAAGNHEFSLYVGEAVEDEAYRNKSLAHVQEAFKDDIRFNSNIHCGVNFVAIDNSYYRFDKPQLDKLKNEAEKGYPIILLIHNPLFERSLFEHAFELHNRYCAYLVGTPDEYLKLGHPKCYEQQKPDAITVETIEYIKNQPLIKAVLAGHVHTDFESYVTNTIPQYITGMTTIRQINVV